ncbi:MAG: hypothetical protein WCJ58_02520 [bacterium]
MLPEAPNLESISDKRIKPETPSYKHNFLRLLQKVLLEPISPQIISLFNQLGWIPDTIVANKIANGQEYSADDVTMSGMQLVLASAQEVLSGNAEEARPKYRTGGWLDALDGPYARHEMTASPIGAAKDMVVDRITEVAVLKMIEKTMVERGMMAGDETTQRYFDNIAASCCYSTLSKSLMEMHGVKLKGSEKGPASMLVRRDALWQVLTMLGDRDEPLQDPNPILQILNLLSESSSAALNQRIKIIIDSTEAIDIFSAEKFQDPNSSASIEALKYATLVDTMQQHFNLDLVAGMQSNLNIQMEEDRLIQIPTVATLNRNVIIAGQPNYLVNKQADVSSFMNQAVIRAKGYV